MRLATTNKPCILKASVSHTFQPYSRVEHQYLISHLHCVSVWVNREAEPVRDRMIELQSSCQRAKRKEVPIGPWLLKPQPGGNRSLLPTFPRPQSAVWPCLPAKGSRKYYAATNPKALSRSQFIE